MTEISCLGEVLGKVLALAPVTALWEQNEPLLSDEDDPGLGLTNDFMLCFAGLHDTVMGACKWEENVPVTGVGNFGSSTFGVIK